MEYDFEIQDSSSIALLTPLTENAQVWVDENVPEHLTYGASIVVESRYLYELTGGILAEKFKVTKDGMEMFVGDDGDFYLRAA